MNTTSEFNVAAAIRSIQGVTVTEYDLYSPSVARVICTVVGDMDRLTMSDRLAAVFGGRAAPIRSSFRWLEKNRSALGFVRITQPVRAYSKTEIESKYTRINANLFMDPSDESIWEVKPGSGGSYLARKGEDNLAELIEANRVSPRGSTPRMHSILSAVAKKSNLVAYVEEEAASVDYGFCIHALSGRDRYSILSSTTHKPVEITADGVVGVYEVEIPAAVQANVRATSKAIASFDPKDPIEYYKQLYFYAPDYLEKLIVEIEQQAAL